MNTFTKLTASALFAALSFASAAQAESVRISLTGKSPTAIQDEITQAAKAVCAKASAADLYAYGPPEECVSATIRESELKLAAARNGFTLAKRDVTAR